LQLLDSGKPQKKLLSLRSYRNLPIRAGLLFDTSESMLTELDHNAFIANLYATHLLRKGIDRAFVMGFDSETRLTQDWTDKPDDIALGIRSIPGLQGSGDSGTAIFDSLYKTCRDRWQIDPRAVTGNFILLFTDGIDNASHARLDDVSTCVSALERRFTSSQISGIPGALPEAEEPSTSWWPKAGADFS